MRTLAAEHENGAATHSATIADQLTVFLAAANITGTRPPYGSSSVGGLGRFMFRCATEPGDQSAQVDAEVEVYQPDLDLTT